jgi:hypothetical protein
LTSGKNGIEMAYTDILSPGLDSIRTSRNRVTGLSCYECGKRIVCRHYAKKRKAWRSVILAPEKSLT